MSDGFDLQKWKRVRPAYLAMNTGLLSRARVQVDLNKLIIIPVEDAGRDLPKHLAKSCHGKRFGLTMLEMLMVVRIQLFEMLFSEAKSLEVGEDPFLNIEKTSYLMRKNSSCQHRYNSERIPPWGGSAPSSKTPQHHTAGVRCIVEF